MASAQKTPTAGTHEKVEIPSVAPLRIPSISIWGILVFLVRDFGASLIVATVLGTLAGGAILGACGLLLGAQLTEPWTTGTVASLKVGGYVLLTIIGLLYIVAGLVQGFLFSVISFVLRKVEVVEEELHAFLEPVTQTLVSRIPFGREGIRVDAFVDVFDAMLNQLYREARPKRFSISFAGNALVRFTFRLVLRAVRWAVDEFFVEELQEAGVTHVSTAQIEIFAREKLTGLVLDRYTMQLKIIRRLVVIAGATLVVLALGISVRIALG